MNIGFFGHSNCAYRSPQSLLDLTAKNLNANVIHTGVRQGSEERILYELKKTKDLDLAIIFHSEPQYLFLPGCDRDFGLNNISEMRIEYLFKNWDTEYWNKYHPNFLQKFRSPDKFYQIINDYRNFLYDPELQKNRYYGSLIQIDHYITFKKIPTVHVTNSSIPSWFGFSSGLIDKSINDLIKKYSSTTFINNLTEEGNKFIAKKLTELVEKLFSSSPGDVAQMEE
jgi:hypothetical protein